MGRIVVGVDGSEHGLAALRWAIDEAARRDATLQVVTAWRNPVAGDAAIPFSVGVDPALLESGATETLEEALRLADLRDEDRARIETFVVQATPARALLEVAEGADLLVVGSRGLGGFKGLLLGSVSSQCVHHASCPVAIIRGGD